MSKTITVSDDVAALLEARREQAGYPSLDAAAEALIAQGIAALNDDHSDGADDAALRALIDEAEASGAEAPWDAAAVKAEILRRYTQRGHGA